MPAPYMAIHTCKVSVSGVDYYTFSFPSVFNQSFFGKTPIITAMAESANDGNINCHVDDINLQTQTAVIRFSANFTGEVNLTAIVR